MFQLGMAYKGNTGFLGWDGVAPRLDPHYRAPAAYLLGLRFLSRKNPEEAAKLFRTVVQDAKPESRLRRLAQAKLDLLPKR